MSIKLAATRAAIVLVPSYTAAWLTEQMVYVVPTLAAAGFFAQAIGVQDLGDRRVDEDEGDDAEEGLPEE